MAFQKIVLFYNQDNRGWTETWWAEGSQLPLTINAPLKKIFEAAIYFRSARTRLEWVRFSEVGAPQKVTSFRMSNIVSPQTNPDSRPDVVSTDAVWKLMSPEYARRTISLRGLVDDSVLRNPATGAFEPTPGLVAQVNDYLKLVKNATWLIRQTQTPANTEGLQQRTVSSIQPLAGDPTRSVLTLPTALTGVAVGEKIRVLGKINPKTLPLFPRTPTVVQIINGPPQQLVIEYQMPYELIYAPYGFSVTPLLFNYQGILNYQFQALSKRDTGRPFGSSRGRRSNLGSRR